MLCNGGSAVAMLSHVALLSLQLRLGSAFPACSGPSSYNEMLEFLTRDNYDANMRPNLAKSTFFNATPDEIYVQLHLNSILSVDQKLQQITLAGFYRTRWWDERLRFNSTNATGCYDKLSIRKDGRIPQSPIHARALTH